jgi:flagellar basal-body rod protein FlgC
MINCLNGIQNTAAALSAERVRLDAISQNIANINNTRGPDGGPYVRQQVVFENVLGQQLARLRDDPRPPQLIYNPSHPDADPDGMVAMPNINLHEEMADMIVASRAFEANLAVIHNARQMALQTLAIGKR